MTGPRVLVYDIERLPPLSWHWDRWNVNIPTSMSVKPGEMCSFSARWYGEPKKENVYFSLWDHGKETMIRELRDRMDEADAEMGYNSDGFDRRHANTEITLAGVDRPSPSIQVDLYKVVKKHFKFESHKLDYVAQALGVGSKVQHEGFGLWIKVMEGDEGARKRFEKYNRHDVDLLFGLRDRLIQWIDTWPNELLYGGVGCPRCGSGRLESRGDRPTKVGLYPKFRCINCGSWSTGGKADKRVDIR